MRISEFQPSTLIMQISHISFKISSTSDNFYKAPTYIITQTSLYICLSTMLQALTARVSYKTKVMHVVKIAIVNLGEKLNSFRIEKY